MSQENFEAFCIEAARLGWQVGVHCLGDAAIDATLSAFEAAHRAAPIAGWRWTLIHMMLAREDHWARANRLGLGGHGSAAAAVHPGRWLPEVHRA